MKYIRFTFLLAGLLFFFACGDDEGLSPEEQLVADLEIIDNYLSSNNLTAESTASGLHYIIEEEGTGENPTTDEPVIFSYQGALTDGTALASSYYGPEVLWLIQTLPGLAQGVPFFKIGGKGKLVLPSSLAFGPLGTSTVPANSVVVFDVELPEHCLADTTFATKQRCLDEIKINQYLTENGLTAEVSATGLHYIIEEEGIGNAKPTLTDNVEVAYKGYLLDGRVFDERTTSFQLGGVIAGWQEGIRLFKKQGKGQLFIPAELAYGGSPPNGSEIPANAALIFDIELLDF